MVKNLPANTRDIRDVGLFPGLGRSSSRGNLGNPLQYNCMENPHGQRSLVGYGLWGHKELDTTEITEHACTHAFMTVKSWIGMWMGTEGNEMSADHLELVLHTTCQEYNWLQHRWEQMAVLRRNDKIGKPGCLLAFFCVGDIIIYEEILRIPRTPNTEISRLNHKIIFQCKIYYFYNTELVAQSCLTLRP